MWSIVAYCILQTAVEEDSLSLGPVSLPSSVSVIAYLLFVRLCLFGNFRSAYMPSVDLLAFYFPGMVFILWIYLCCTPHYLGEYLCAGLYSMCGYVLVIVVVVMMLLNYCFAAQLERIMCGTREVGNLAELRSHTSYKGCFDDKHQIIKWFWVRATHEKTV